MKHEKDEEIRNALMKRYCTGAVKKLTDADIKFIATSIITSRGFDPDTDYPVYNGGVTAKVGGYMHAILQFIHDMMMSYPTWGAMAEYWHCTRGNAQQQFDRARMIVLKLDSDLYMKFIN